MKLSDVPAGHLCGTSVSEVAKDIGDMGDVDVMKVTLPRDHVSITIEELQKQKPHSAADGSAADYMLERSAADGSATDYMLERVPEWVRQVDPEVYSPRYISIGPMHDGRCRRSENPLRRQDLKIAHMRRLMKNQHPYYHDYAGLKPVDNIKVCFDGLKDEVDHTRRFYAERFDSINDDDWAMMLLLDGCFIITHLLDFALGIENEFTAHSKWVRAAIKIDLILLENQIPFSILEKIINYVRPNDQGNNLKILKGLVVHYWVQSKKEVKVDKVHHLVHLVYEAHCQLIYNNNYVKMDCSQKFKRSFICLILFLVMKLLSFPLKLLMSQKEEGENIPSAKELDNLGIHFCKMNDKYVQSQYDMHIIKALDSDALFIPQIKAIISAAPVLHNLIAWEHVAGAKSDSAKCGYFAKYAFLMYNLINSHDDIALLQEKGILINNCGTDEQVVTYFKNIALWTIRDPDLKKHPPSRTHLQKVTDILLCKKTAGGQPNKKAGIDKVWEVLRGRKQQPEHKFFAEVMKYFDSPLQILLVLTSFVVFVATILPALLSVHSTK